MKIGMGMTRRISAGSLALLLLLSVPPDARSGGSVPPAPAAGGEPAAPESREPTPPRISYIHGEVSLWRPGAPDWAPAALNMPLGPGDVLYAGPAGNVEIQLGARAFARAAYGTQIGLDNQEPDFIQLRVTAGYAALDLRELLPGHTVELATPGGAFTVDRTGYYHAEVGGEVTLFRSYRGGTATATASGGGAVPVATNQQLVITGTESPRVETTAAPALTAWDRWNYQRSDYLAQSPSARHLSPGVYGAEALDQYGTWRTVETYGTVWVPSAVAPGWSPYTTGRWIWDPRFGWTWLDDAPWGWAPYHYGRWVFAGGYWAWAPGPVVVRAAYAPALVVFLGGPVVVGRPLCWAPLGWGEPVIPWWGGAGFVGVAWWGGWGGPRVVNNVVVSRSSTVHVTNITVYRHVNVTNAVVGVPAERFGREGARPARITDASEVRQLTPVRGSLEVRPVSSSVTGGAGPAATRPPDAVRTRPVVTTRAPRDVGPGLREQGLPAAAPAAAPEPRQRIVPAPPRPAPPPAAAVTPGPTGPATGPARGSAPGGRRQGPPPAAGAHAPGPAGPAVAAPTPGTPVPAPSVAAPQAQPAPPGPAGRPAVRSAPPAPPAPGVQGAPAPQMRSDPGGGRRHDAPAERPPRGEPQGKGSERGSGDRGGPDRGPR